MIYTWELALYIALVLSAGGFLQSIAGFAYGLFAIPILMMLGLSTADAMVIVLVACFAQTVLGAWTLRSYVPRGYVLYPTMLRMVFSIAGALLLQMITETDPSLMYVIIGVILILSVVSIWTLQKKGISRVHGSWLYIASISSGFIGGFIGMGGPPLVLWSMVQSWESKQIRGYLFTMFGLSAPFQIVLFAYVFGSGVWSAALFGLCCAPLVLLGSFLGIRIGNALSITQLRYVAYVLLLVLGIKSIISYFV